MEMDFIVKWEKQHNVIERTLEGFWQTYRSWKKEEKAEYQDLFMGKLDDDFIVIDVEAVAWRQYYDREESGSVFYCYLRLYYVKQYIGQYYMVFQPDGTTIDDNYIFEDRTSMRANLSETKYNLRFARKALAEGINAAAIAKITGLDSEVVAKLQLKRSR